jgi:hypothetical protein
MNKLIDDIDENNKQREINDCIKIKLSDKMSDINNTIEILNKEKESINNRLEYIDSCKKVIVEGLVKKLEQAFTNESNQVNQDILSESSPCLKLDQK